MLARSIERLGMRSLPRSASRSPTGIHYRSSPRSSSPLSLMGPVPPAGCRLAGTSRPWMGVRYQSSTLLTSPEAASRTLHTVHPRGDWYALVLIADFPVLASWRSRSTSRLYAPRCTRSTPGKTFSSSLRGPTGSLFATTPTGSETSACESGFHQTSLTADAGNSGGEGPREPWCLSNTSGRRPAAI